MLARVLAALRIDRRSPGQIEAEIEDEFQLHLALLEEEMLNAGVPPAGARAAAERRFGNIMKHRDECRWVNMKERIVLQRMNLLLAVMIGSGLLWTAIASAQAERRHAGAIEALQQELRTLQSPGPDAGGGEPGERQAEGSRLVKLRGAVRHEGNYAVPENGRLNVARLVEAAGGVIEPGAEILVQREVLRVSADDRDALEKLFLEPGDTVSVAAPGADERRAVPPAGEAGAGNGHFYISGTVARVGLYALPQGTLTVRRAIVMAGGAAGNVEKATVQRKNGESEVIDLTDAQGPDAVLGADDLIIVR